jgi:hypothetical protein
MRLSVGPRGTRDSAVCGLEVREARSWGDVAASSRHLSSDRPERGVMLSRFAGYCR